MTSTALASPVPVDTLGPSGPVPGLTKQVIELLDVGKRDLVVDLDCRDIQPSRAMPEQIRPGAQRIPLSPFSERLAFLLTTSGVRMAQMGWQTFERFPMRCKRVLVRTGSPHFNGSLRRSLAAVFNRLDPAGRLLIVDNAPGSDTPLFDEGLRRWEQQRHSPEAIADLMRAVGFRVQTETVEYVRQVSTAECYAWVESRAWPILAILDEAELQRGLRELRTRYGSQSRVQFTSRFDLVLGTKPSTLARPQRAPRFGPGARASSGRSGLPEV